MNDTDLREDTNPINEFLITISIMSEQGWINQVLFLEQVFSVQLM